MTTKSSRVFVLQATRLQADVSPAAVYGEIRFVLSAGDRTSANPELSLRKLREGLSDFDSGKDFIVWAGGDSLSAILAGKVLAELKINRFRFLRFEKNRNTSANQPVTGYYSPIEINLEEG